MANPRPEFRPHRIISLPATGYVICGAMETLFYYLAEGMEAARMKAGKLARLMSLFLCLYQIFGCALVYLRRKEDRWTLIIAVGILESRHGLVDASCIALLCGAVWGLLEGIVEFVRKRKSKKIEDPMPLDVPLMRSGESPVPDSEKRGAATATRIRGVSSSEIRSPGNSALREIR